jgi:hypothetical protein
MKKSNSLWHMTKFEILCENKVKGPDVKNIGVICSSFSVTRMYKSVSTSYRSRATRPNKGIRPLSKGSCRKSRSIYLAVMSAQ